MHAPSCTRSLLSRGLYTMEGTSLEEVPMEGMPMRVGSGTVGERGVRERDEETDRERERKGKIAIETERSR